MVDNYIRNNDDDENGENGKRNTNNNDRGKRGGGHSSSVSMDNSSSSSTTSEVSSECDKKRRVKEDYRIKYAYLDYVSTIDVKGLECLAEDVHSGVEILKNSYLAIVNSLVILNERRRKRRQQKIFTENANNANANTLEANSSSTMQANSSNFLNSKVAQNFRNSDQESLSSYPDTYEWNIDKFCDPATRDIEFQRLFQEADKYYNTVERVKNHTEPVNMTRFGSLVRQGKSLLGIIELLNNNYSNNFLDIFRLS